MNKMLFLFFSSLILLSCGGNARFDGITLSTTSEVISGGATLGQEVGSVFISVSQCSVASYSLLDDFDGLFEITSQGKIVMAKEAAIAGVYNLTIIGKCDNQIAQETIKIVLKDLTFFSENFLGTYTYCDDRGTHSYLNQLTITKETYELSGEGYYTTDCTGATFAAFSNLYSIKLLLKKDDILCDLNSNLDSMTYTIYTAASYYNGIPLCGHTDWVVNVPKIVSGDDCTNNGGTAGLYDTNGGFNPDIGADYFNQFKLYDNKVEVSDHDDQAGSPEGLTEADRVNIFPGKEYTKI